MTVQASLWHNFVMINKQCWNPGNNAMTGFALSRCIDMVSRLLMACITGTEYVVMVDHNDRIERNRIVAGITDVTGIYMADILACCNCAVMTIHAAVRRNFRVVHRGNGYP